MLNSFLLSFKWFFALLTIKTDVVIFGTDPQFSYYIIPFIKILRPDLRFAIWVFDMHPEMMISDGMRLPGLVKKALIWWTGISYRWCGLLVDIGVCMRNRLLVYHPKAIYETIIPWALQEPDILEEPNNDIRYELFGDTKLAILYSGTIAKAHQFEEFILLARELRTRKSSVSFCFAGMGNNYQKLQDMVTADDTNISFAGFIEEKYLSLRLASADIHMISLRPGWEGIAVPSKFFGSLASGRPLLYCGTPNSCVTKLINKEGLGFVVTKDNIKNIADNLEELSYNHKKLHMMQEKAFLFYKQHFTKELQCMKWDNTLRNYIKIKN
jgi:glycosyltransferase involved in cell wall biosynthesis